MDAVPEAALLADWRDLWSVAEEAAASRRDDPRFVLEPIGLFLQPPGEGLDPDYDATPPSSVTFASTGGDGVHFSALTRGDETFIIMTVPMQFDRPNVAVGAGLREFLCLGCRHGYFWLEQLAYDHDATVARLDAASDVAPDEEALLRILRDRLRLAPWPRVGDRLRELARLI